MTLINTKNNLNYILQNFQNILVTISPGPHVIQNGIESVFYYCLIYGFFYPKTCYFFLHPHPNDNDYKREILNCWNCFPTSPSSQLLRSGIRETAVACINMKKRKQIIMEFFFVFIFRVNIKTFSLASL